MARPNDVKLAIFRAIAKNAAMGIPAIRRARIRSGRTALPVDPSLVSRYSYDLLDEVLKHTGPVSGKSVLEIGPGDNLLAGLAFVAAGARAYAALDRFPGPYADATARRWYELLAEDWPNKYPDLQWPADLDPATFPEDPRVEVIPHGVEVVKNYDEFDLVCSYVVGEHVVDIDAFAEATRQAIGSNGVAVHVIDFGGHEWNINGDPFLFLKFSKVVWRLMASNRGLPNRVRFDEYKACFERHGLVVDVAHRVLVDFDPADEWVRQRATEDFLTHWAVLVLRRA